MTRMPLVMALGIGILLSGCQTLPSTEQRRPVTLTVSAASDLTAAFTEIGTLYTEQTGVGTVFNFGSTGQLAQQIDKGAPIDVFAAANVSYVDDLEQKGLVLSGTKVLYAIGRLTLWTRTDSPLHIERLEELAGPEIQHIAIANPEHAPYGVAAQQAMQSVGIWDKVQSKLVLGENVSQALQYAQTGNVDVAIAPLSLSTQGDGRWVLIPENLHSPIKQGMAVIKSTVHEREARAFVEFIDSQQARQIMRKYGFVLPGEEPVK